MLIPISPANPLIWAVWSSCRILRWGAWHVRSTFITFQQSRQRKIKSSTPYLLEICTCQSLIGVKSVTSRQLCMTNKAADILRNIIPATSEELQIWSTIGSLITGMQWHADVYHTWSTDGLSNKSTLYSRWIIDGCLFAYPEGSSQSFLGKENKTEAWSSF